MHIGKDKCEVLNFVDAGTNYGERTIVARSDTFEMSTKLESEYIYHHEAPKYFSTDPEIIRPILTKILSADGIIIQERCPP